MNNDERVQLAVAAIEQLEAIHQRFINCVQNLANHSVHAGSLVVHGNQLSATCLGIPLSVKRKIVVHHNYPAFIEYAFVSSKQDSEQLIFVVYLGKDGGLWTDLHSETRLCDFDNAYLAQHLLNAIAIKLLDSEIFKPTLNCLHWNE